MNYKTLKEYYFIIWNKSTTLLNQRFIYSSSKYRNSHKNESFQNTKTFKLSKHKSIIIVVIILAMTRKLPLLISNRPFPNTNTHIHKIQRRNGPGIVACHTKTTTSTTTFTSGAFYEMVNRVHLQLATDTDQLFDGEHRGKERKTTRPLPFGQRTFFGPV